MRLLNFFFLFITLCFFGEFLKPELNLEIPNDPILMINDFLPDSVRFLRENGFISVEFCPDNTCDLIVVKKEMNLKLLKDFVYLYIYFFSDYYILDDWRKNSKTKDVAKIILSKQQYVFCEKETDIDKARCLLGYLSKKYRIILFEVRYDEDFRSLTKKDLNLAISYDRTK